MDKSITVSNSPCSAERLAGTSKQVFELSSDLYGLIQKWNLLNSNGKNIITGISKLKAEKWNKDAFDQKGLDLPSGLDSNHATLEQLCDQLASTTCEMESILKRMKQLKDQCLAIEKLEEFQHKKGGHSNSEQLAPLFQTWPTSRFGEVITSICYAYTEEMKIKKCIAENIALCDQRETINLHKIAWVHEVCITSTTNSHLESLLTETGHQ